MKKVLIGIGILVVLFILYGFVAYNSLVKLDVAADTQWKQVETQYQRRFDLIPGLVESVKKVAAQEVAVYTAIADARARYSGATTPEARAKAANELEGALSRLLVIVENYPQLRTSEVVQAFMAEQTGTENRIAVERSRFNAAVENYNLAVRRIPSSIIAAITGFDERDYFNAAEGAEVAPKIDLEN